MRGGQQVNRQVLLERFGNRWQGTEEISTLSISVVMASRRAQDVRPWRPVE